MIVSPLDLLPEIRAGRVILNLGDRDLNNPEGVGFDLRLNSLLRIRGGTGSLRVETRRTPATEDAVPDSDGLFNLQPGASYLASTCETFDLPDGLAAQFFPRSTLFRSGVIFQSSILPPGYIGPMTFAIYNSTEAAFELQRGARFAHAVFLLVSSTATKYRGQWQGGRISQPDDERQI